MRSDWKCMNIVIIGAMEIEGLMNLDCDLGEFVIVL